MREIISIEELHGIILDLAKEFHRICVKNHIPYYLAGGSMLGAIRHKGFIPWDDDVDLYVPRQFFNQLKQVFEKELPNYYCLRTIDDIPLLWGELMKMEDKRVLIKETLGKNGCFEHGLFIDIFPLDYTDMSKRLLSRHQTVLNLLKLHSVCKRNNHSPKTLFAKAMCLLFGRNCFIKLIKRVVRSKGNYLTNYSGAYGEKEAFKVEVIGKPTSYAFCDTFFYGVEKPEEYLTHIYGDYMQLPPEDKRRVHILKAYYKE